MKMLITGCGGFIGYHVAKYYLSLGVEVLGLDSLKPSANLSLLRELDEYFPRFKHRITDLNYITPSTLEDIDMVINLAAETHVDRSIENNFPFIYSNVTGVDNLLRCIVKSSSKPGLLHFSTDEVYGDSSPMPYNESDILNPSNPYSATKAASDMLIKAYHHTFGLDYNIIRPTNNYGFGQATEKFIPRTIKSLKAGYKVPLYDGGHAKRNWLHVSDTVAAVDTIILNWVPSKIYNVAGVHEFKNIEVAEKITKALGLNGELTEYFDYDTTRLGHDMRYHINDTRLRSLGWQPKADFDEELEKLCRG